MSFSSSGYADRINSAFADFAPTEKRSEGFRPMEDEPAEVVGRDPEDWFRDLHQAKLKVVSPKAKKGKKRDLSLVSLENFDPSRSRNITSPRSVEALLRLGIDPKELQKHGPAYFQETFGYDEEEAKEEAELYERRRSRFMEEALAERNKLVEGTWKDFDQELMKMPPPDDPNPEIPEAILERETRQMEKMVLREKADLKAAIVAEYQLQVREEKEREVERKLKEREEKRKLKVLKKHEEEEAKRVKIEEQRKVVEQELKQKKKKMVRKLKEKDQVVAELKKKKKRKWQEKALETEKKLQVTRARAKAIQERWEEEERKKFARKQKLVEEQVARKYETDEVKYEMHKEEQHEAYDRVVTRKARRPVEQHRIEVVENKLRLAASRRKEREEREKQEREERRRERIMEERKRKARIRAAEKEREERAKVILATQEAKMEEKTRKVEEKKQESVRRLRIKNQKRKKELARNRVRLKRQEEYRRQTLETKLEFDKRRAQRIEVVQAAELRERQLSQKTNIIRRAALNQSLDKVRAGKLGDIRGLDIEALDLIAE